MLQASQADLEQRLEDIELQRKYSLAQWHDDVTHVKEELLQMECALKNSLLNTDYLDDETGLNQRSADETDEEKDTSSSAGDKGQGHIGQDESQKENHSDNDVKQPKRKRRKTKRNIKVPELSPEEIAKLPVLMRPRPKREKTSELPLTSKDRLAQNRRSFQQLVTHYRARNKAKERGAESGQSQVSHASVRVETDLQRYRILFATSLVPELQYFLQHNVKKVDYFVTSVDKKNSKNLRPEKRRNIFANSDNDSYEAKLTRQALKEQHDRQREILKKRQAADSTADDRIIRNRQLLKGKLPEISRGNRKPNQQDKQRQNVTIDAKKRKETDSLSSKEQPSDQSSLDAAPKTDDNNETDDVILTTAAPNEVTDLETVTEVAEDGAIPEKEQQIEPETHHTKDIANKYKPLPQIASKNDFKVSKAFQKWKKKTTNKEKAPEGADNDPNLDEEAFYGSRPDLNKRRISMDDVKSCRYLRGYDPPVMKVPTDLGRYIFNEADVILEEGEDNQSAE